MLRQCPHIAAVLKHSLPSEIPQHLEDSLSHFPRKHYPLCHHSDISEHVIDFRDRFRVIVHLYEEIERHSGYYQCRSYAEEMPCLSPFLEDPYCEQE